jgi:polyisoprenoid-binding protein YceI
MRRLLPALAALALLWPAAGQVAEAPDAGYVLDRAHTRMVAKVMQLGAPIFTLRFAGVEASLAYDPAHPEAAKVQATVDTTHFDTDALWGRRFAEDFLEPARFPAATFVSTAVSLAADGRSGVMIGDLTLRGVTRPVRFKVTFLEAGRDPGEAPAAGFRAVGQIKRSQFGSTFLRHWVGDDVRIEIEAQFARKS